MPTALQDEALPSPVPSEYRLLVEQVRAAGLLEPRIAWYGAQTARIALALAGGWAMLFVVGNSWASLGVALFYGAVFGQVVMLGHDAGHQQIFRSSKANRRFGLVAGDLLTGLAWGWWVPKHNAHHAHPNQVGRDPDIAAGVIAFTPEIARTRRGLTRLLVSRQAWLFFPLLLLEGIALHYASVQEVRRRHDAAGRLELILLVVNAALLLAPVFLVLSPLRALAFLAIEQGAFGLYLGCTFAPNHKGMPLLREDCDLSFVRRQILTSRNVAGGALTTFALGGLNYQIEHHLFPGMPRPNLALAQPIVRAFCAEHDLDYREESLAGSYHRALAHLHRVGAGVGAGPITITM